MENTQTIRFADGTIFTPSLLARSERLNESVAENRRQDTLLPDMLERQVMILNRLGLHARPAAEFVRAARNFRSEITILKNGECYSACSILDVLSANLDCGSTMIIRAVGPDAEAAMERLCFLLHEFKRQEEADGI